MEPIIIKFASDHSLINRVLSFSMILCGWYFISYPAKHPEWAAWSNALYHIGQQVFPTGAEIHSFWDLVGVLLITSGIILSGKAQQILSHPYLLWLGAQSFPIYLIHGPLLRSFLNWTLYAFATPDWYEESENDTVTRVFARHPIPPAWKFVLWLPLYFMVLLYLADLWAEKIEPRCASVSKWLEDTICGREDDTPVTTQMFLKEFGGLDSQWNSRSSSPEPNNNMLPR